MFDVEMRGDVAVVTMAHGKANAIDAEFCEAIPGKLDELRHEASAVVLTGQGKIFSAGVDLVRFVGETQTYADMFIPLLSRAFSALYAFPKPLITAINGHAIAGGCIIGIAGDQRLMAAGTGTIGVPELKVGMPFPAMALEMVRQTCGRATERVLYKGELFTPEQGLEVGLIDAVVSAETLIDDAVALATDLASRREESFAVTKWQIREQVFLRLDELRDEEDEVERIWRDPASKEHIQQFIDKTFKRG
jgi:enoyl-CoA hydratase